PYSVHKQFAETVGEKILQADVLLMDEALLRQRALGQEIEDGTHACRRGHLDGAVHLASDWAAVDLVGIGLLDQPALAAAADRDKNYDDVLCRSRQGVFQYVLQQIAAMSEAQIVEQCLHDPGVPGMWDGAVIERVHLALQCLGERAEPA